MQGDADYHSNVASSPPSKVAIYVGNPGQPGVTPGYASTDTSALINAIAAIGTAGGGDVYVLPNAVFIPIVTTIFNASLLNLHWGKGAYISIPAGTAGTAFNATVVNGGSANTPVIVEVANCDGVDFHDLEIRVVDTGSPWYGVHKGGLLTNFTEWGTRTSGCQRFGDYTTSYFAQGALTYDGSSAGLTSWGVKSSGNGSTGSTHDGGHAKIANGATTGTLSAVHRWNDYGVLLPILGIDLPMNNFGAAGISTWDVLIHGAHLEGTSGANQNIGINAEFNSSTQFDSDLRVEQCYVSGFTWGYGLDASHRHVKETNNVAFNCSLGGMRLGPGNSTQTAVEQCDWDIDNFTARQCVIGIQIRSSTFGANGGLSGIHVRGGGSYDEGSTLNTTGIQVISAATKTQDHVHIEDFNVQFIAGGGTALDVSSVTAGAMSAWLLEDCPGIAGGQAYSLGTSFDLQANNATVAGTLAVTGVTTLTAALALSANISKLNGLTTAGSNGVSAILGRTLQKSETGGDANLLTVTPPAVAGTYRVHVLLTVATITSAPNITVTVDYTDSEGFHQVALIIEGWRVGTAAGFTAVALAAHGIYNWEADIDIDNSAHNILLAIVLNSGTSYTGHASASVEQVTQS